MAPKAKFARPDSASGTENESIALNLLSNDKGGKLSVQKMDGTGKAAVGDIIAETPEGAVVRLASLDGSVTVDPGTSFDYLSRGEILETGFTYSVGNGNAGKGKGGVSTATVNLTITGENDAPVLRDDYLDLEWHMHTRVRDVGLVTEWTTSFAGVTLLENDTDVDHLDTLVFLSVRSSPDLVYLRIEDGLVNGNVTLSVREGFSGQLELKYLAGTGYGSYSEGTLFIDVPPAPLQPATWGTSYSTTYDDGDHLRSVRTYDDPANSDRNFDSTSNLTDYEETGELWSGYVGEAIIGKAYYDTDRYGTQITGTDEHDGATWVQTNDYVMHQRWDSRALMEFDVTAAGLVTGAVLRFDLNDTAGSKLSDPESDGTNITTALNEGAIELYLYAGDGSITALDRDAGELGASFTFTNTGYGTGSTGSIVLDETLIREVLEAERVEPGADYLGIGVRAVLEDPGYPIPGDAALRQFSYLQLNSNIWLDLQYG